MKINFTKKEYKTLLDMIEIADWVMTAHEIEIDKSTSYHILTQKLYSYAKDFGLENLIEFAEELNEYFPTYFNEVEGSGREILDKYDNDTFWDELIERLVDRDIEKEIGKEKYSELSIEKKFEMRSVYEKKYHEEFDENELANLRIL